MNFAMMTPIEHAKRYDPRNDPFLISDFRHAWKIRNEPYPLHNDGHKTEEGKRYCRNQSRFVLRIKIERLRLLKQEGKLPRQLG